LGQLAASEKTNGQLLRRQGSLAQDGAQTVAWTVAEKENLLDNFGRLVSSELQLVKAVETLGGQPAQVAHKQPVVLTPDIDLQSLQSHIFPAQDPSLDHNLRGQP